MNLKLFTISENIVFADHGGGKIPPWEEDNGVYGIMVSVLIN